MSSVAASGPAIRTQRTRAIAASTVGTTIEWYDFFLYGTAAALVFPKVFFPGHTLYSGVLLSFGTQFVGFAARPIGAMIFGHYGDRIGRKTTLIATLLLMGIATFLMGLLPTYAAIGAAAPILLASCASLQGIGVGGEWGGSVLLSMEWGKQRRRGFMASWPQVGVPVGCCCPPAWSSCSARGRIQLRHAGAGGCRSCSASSWSAIGLYVRLRVRESPAFSRGQAPEGDRPPAGLAGHQGTAAGDPRARRSSACPSRRRSTCSSRSCSPTAPTTWGSPRTRCSTTRSWPPPSAWSASRSSATCPT